MNIETEHKNKKAHHNMKDGRDKDTLQTALSRAAAHAWQEQQDAQQEFDTAQNGEDIHMASIFSNFRLNQNSY